MLRLENYGITPSSVTVFLICAAITVITVAAAGILLYCLFGIGLAGIAKKKGEEKEWYAYLPLLRFYALGKMTCGSEKTKKVFGCLLPSLYAAKFVLCTVSSVLLARGAAGLIFAAENASGSAIEISSLVSFPVNYYIAVLAVTLAVSAAAKVISAVCFYGAFSVKGKATAAVFTILTFICRPLGAIFLYAASKEGKSEKSEE